MSGPVQVLVVGFEEPSFSGEVIAELTRLREVGVVRLVDVLLVRRDEDGAFETLPPEEFPHLVEAASGFAAPPEPGRAFETGLGLLIAGLEHQRPGPPRED